MYGRGRSSTNASIALHLAWLIILGLLLAGFVSVCVQPAYGRQEPRALEALYSLPLYFEDRAPQSERLKDEQYRALARATTAAAKDKRELAFLLAWGWHETKFSLRIAAGNCKPWECDRGLARSPWQLHRNGMSAEQWALMQGSENIAHQAEEAARRARGMLAWCGSAEGAFRAMTGRGCSASLYRRDATARVATYRRVLGRL
jgi:hypothetical protein